jgi:hypothetical protein
VGAPGPVPMWPMPKSWPELFEFITAHVFKKRHQGGYVNAPKSDRNTAVTCGADLRIAQQVTRKFQMRTCCMGSTQTCGHQVRMTRCHFPGGLQHYTSLQSVFCHGAHPGHTQ